MNVGSGVSVIFHVAGAGAGAHGTRRDQSIIALRSLPGNI